MSLEKKIKEHKSWVKSRIPWYRFFARWKAGKDFNQVIEPIRGASQSILDVCTNYSNAYAKDIADSVLSVGVYTKDKTVVESYIDLLENHKYAPSLVLLQLVDIIGHTARIGNSRSSPEVEFKEMTQRGNPFESARRTRLVIEQYNSDSFRHLIGLFEPEVAKGLAHDIGCIVCYTKDASVQHLIGILENFRNQPKIAENISIGIVKVGIHTENKELTDLAISLIEDYADKPEIIDKLAEHFKLFAESGGNKENLKLYLSICRNLKTGCFKPHVYDEFKDEILEKYKKRYDEIPVPRTEDSCEYVKKLCYLVEKERDFLNQQTSERVFPLAVMLCDLGDDYAGKIKQQSGYALDNLVKAYSIARNNPKDIPMEQFYEPLKGALDRGFADKWAKAIVDGYRNRKDEGLKQVLKDVA